MRVELKGLHRVRRKLADGTWRVYHYAWRGGPKIEAEPGTPEFLAEWHRLSKGRDDPDARFKGTLQLVINQYQRTPEFSALAESTRKDYVRRIAKRIEPKFGKMPLRAVEDDRARAHFLEWRDKLAEESGPREADYCFAVLARIVSWAHHRRIISKNQCERPGRLHSGSRAEIIWTEAEIEALLAAASPQVALPFAIALETGQRQSDVLHMTWAQYDGAAIRLRQSKTGKRLVVPLTAALRTRLDALRRDAPVICLNSRGKPWTADGFKSSFAEAKARAVAAGAERIRKLTFHDTRGTAVVNLAIAGCTVPEIASITGHALKDAEAILDAHYLGRDRRLGESAIEKLEEHSKRKHPVNRSVNAAPKRDGSAM
ncbi:tyrosine-type recombinase/integrase [Rhodobacter lacus]|uniref:Tyrosine-type recombinase/integrase n=1 Tax=Rhodobacter lacus TaxID=1641972 RepID=A0ABW5A6J7_9RHOB